MITLRTDNGDFDLFGNEDIVQTFSMFNLQDLTSRGGEYSNVFNLPLTSNNQKLIEYASFIPSINTAPYKKITCTILIDGLEFKSAFLVIESVKDTIKARVFSGNSNFYDLTKSLYLTELDWNSYNHIWNYTNAEANLANLTDYVYPLINYNGQNLSSNILDIRKVLPATFCRAILDKIISSLGYTSVYSFDDEDFNKALIPYSKKNPTIASEVILLNQVDVGYSYQYTPPVTNFVSTINQWASGITVFSSDAYSPDGVTFTANDGRIDNNFNIINTAGSSTFFDTTTEIFTAGYAGTYDYDFTTNLLDYDYMKFYFSPNITAIDLTTSTRLIVTKISSGVRTLVTNVISNSGRKTGATTSPILTMPQTFITNTNYGSIYLEVGEQLEFKLAYHFYGTFANTGTPTTVTATFNPTILDTSTITVDLQPALVFGGLITYKSLLPKIKCSEFLKDMFIRFGIIPQINEDDKVITLNYFDKISENVLNAKDWSSLLDESEFIDNSFSYTSYAQNNIIKHKPDTTIVYGDLGESYNLKIDNQNLILEKDLYVSPFSQSENNSFNGTLTAYINLYDSVTDKFLKDVNYRICFSEKVINGFKVTDGTTTSTTTDTVRCWFIDDSQPNLSMGFGMNLMNKNSKTLISTLQNLRIIRVNLNLNLLHIKNLDYFIPIYCEQLQSYFFISSINQFNYTNPNLTEVELIKLNA